MGNFKKNKQREKNEIIQRTKEERLAESRKIIAKLTELQLTVIYAPIKQLFILIQDFVDNANRHEVNIPFPMINKRIKGILSNSINEKIWVKRRRIN